MPHPSKEDKPLQGGEIYGFVAALKVIQIAGYDYKLNHAARRVLMILMGHVDQQGTCFPSISKIAKELQLSRAAITKQIRLLEKHGYLETHNNYSRSGGQKANTYIMRLHNGNAHRKTPHILSKNNIKIFWQNTATLLCYMGVTSRSHTPPLPQRLQAGATSKSCTKKPITKNNKKKSENIPTINSKLLQKKAKLDMQEWEAENKFHEETGISKADIQTHTEIKTALKQYITQSKLTDHLLTITKNTKSLQPKEAISEQIEQLEKILASEIEKNENVST